MRKNKQKGQILIFEKVINGSTARVIENGSFLKSEATGDIIKFDRSRPDLSSELSVFLEAQANAGTILRSDVSIWHLWLIDDGSSSAATLIRGDATREREGPQICHWKGYDFAGF